jgi:hypothetical protein
VRGPIATKFFVVALTALIAVATAGSADADDTAWRDIFRTPQASIGGESAPKAVARERTVLTVNGMIGPGAYRQFRAALYNGNPDLVVLNGPGGILEEAFLIAEEVRRRGLDTLVAPNGACASACAVVYLAGRNKYLGSGGAIGLHSASSADGRADAEATAIMAEYLSRLGVPQSTLRRMAQTAPSDIRWLTRSELRAVGIRAYSSAQ